MREQVKSYNRMCSVSCVLREIRDRPNRSPVQGMRDESFTDLPRSYNIRYRSRSIWISKRKNRARTWSLISVEAPKSNLVEPFRMGNIQKSKWILYANKSSSSMTIAGRHRTTTNHLAPMFYYVSLVMCVSLFHSAQQIKYLPQRGKNLNNLSFDKRKISAQKSRHINWNALRKRHTIRFISTFSLFRGIKICKCIWCVCRLCVLCGPWGHHHNKIYKNSLAVATCCD